MPPSATAKPRAVDRIPPRGTHRPALRRKSAHAVSLEHFTYEMLQTTPSRDQAWRWYARQVFRLDPTLSAFPLPVAFRRLARAGERCLQVLRRRVRSRISRDSPDGADMRAAPAKKTLSMPSISDA